MIEKIAETSQPINEIIAKRWSIRAFDINKQVSKEQIISICEAARWAPSCGNDQPYRFIVWDYYTNREAYQKAYTCFDEGNSKWVHNAPVVICALAGNLFRKAQTFNRWAQFDTGAAAMNMYLQAVTLGLMAHPFGGFYEDKVKEEFNIPENFEPMAMIAIGYQADNIDMLSEYNQKREKADRERVALKDNFFDSEWNNPII